MHHFSRSFLAVASVATLGLTACSSHRQLATQAVGFNLTVEKAQNEMLLLNVIRAKDRLPMYLTGISGLTGNFQTTFTTGFTGTYTGQRQQTQSATPATVNTLTRAYTPSFGGSLSKNPTFTLAVLDTQEFMRGFLTPLGKETLAHYWTQGWPPELLVYLLVQRVEIDEPGKPLLVLRNYPDNADPDLRELKSFAKWVRQNFLSKNPQIEAVPVPVNIGPKLSGDEVADLNELIQLAKEGLVLKEADGDYQLQRERTDFSFKLAPDKNKPDVGKKKLQESEERQQYFQRLIQEPERMDISGIDSKVTTTFVLRSPEALLYYLGELTRLANRKSLPPVVPHICIQGRYQPLFVALPAGTCTNTQVDADAGRERFSIPITNLPSSSENCEAGALRLEEPTCEGGRSMQAMRLLSQIISLQKSAQDLPSTAFIRVIEN